MSADSGKLKKGLKVKHKGKAKIVKDWHFISNGMHNGDTIVITFKDGSTTGDKGFTDVEYIDKEKTESKRVKINFKTVNREGWTPIDMSKVYEDAEKRWKESQECYKKDLAEEEKRVKALKCPCCKSKNKQYIHKWDNNGILGPGSRSWTTDEYYICGDCGIHFSDLNKKEIKPPERGLFNFR